MAKQQIIREIREICLANANAVNVIKYSRYFKEGLYDGYGLTSPMIYDAAKVILSAHTSLQPVLDAADEILRKGRYEEISIIMLVAKGLHKQFSKETFTAIEKWYHIGINNWAHADTLGMMILPIFLKKDIADIEDFKSWLTSENKYQRRSVPVTFIKLLKTLNHYSELFNFIECLMTDSEREVHQGAGWFLREAWKRKPDETEVFLMKWKETTPRLIIQYATEKMTKEGKMKFKRSNRHLTTHT